MKRLAFILLTAWMTVIRGGNEDVMFLLGFVWLCSFIEPLPD